MSLRWQVKEQWISFKYGAGGIRGPGPAPEMLTPRNSTDPETHPAQESQCRALSTGFPLPTREASRDSEGSERAVRAGRTSGAWGPEGEAGATPAGHVLTLHSCSLTRVLILHAHTQHICSHRTHITVIMHTEYRCSHSSHLLTLHARSLTCTLITHPHNDHTHRMPIAHTFPCTLPHTFTHNSH